MILSIIRVILDKCISRFEIGTSWQSANRKSLLKHDAVLLSFSLILCYF